jgi:hypothetical protein
MHFDAKHDVHVVEVAPPLAAASAAALVGLVALPTLLNVSLAGVWFAAAIICALVTLIALPALARPLAAALGRLPQRTIAASETLLLARLLIVAIELIVLQGMLRRPVALVLINSQPIAVEAGIAAGALSLLLILLVWTYQTGRGLLRAVAWTALDAIPTVSAPTPGAAAADVRTIAVSPNGGITLPANVTLPNEH